MHASECLFFSKRPAGFHCRKRPSPTFINTLAMGVTERGTGMFAEVCNEMTCSKEAVYSSFLVHLINMIKSVSHSLYFMLYFDHMT